MGYKLTTMITAQGQRAAGRPAAASGGASTFRQRLLDGLAASLAEEGYRNTTVADIVRRARTSRRTFYEHFPDKEACFAALIADANAVMIQQIAAAVDARAPWEVQIRQAVEEWITCSESQPTITLSWIRDLPSLGAAARRLQRDMMEAFIVLIQALTGTEELRAAGVRPVTRQRAIILVGGLSELIAATVEDGGRVSDITEAAVQATMALLGPPA